MIESLKDCERLIKKVHDNPTTASADKAIKKFKRHQKRLNG